MEINKEEIQNIIDDEIKAAEKRFGKEFKKALIRIISLEKMLHPEKPEKKSRKIPLSEWEKYHPYPTESALRQYYFYRETNGFDEVVDYGGENGGRILIDEDKYFEWQKNRKNKKLKK